jgi:glutamine phosphoribosylpyrophosphate amidotransferase
MSGIFGIVSNKNCADDLLYGTDYHSHMGTEYGGMAVFGKQFYRSIHDISKSQFKSKFYDDYKEMKGHMGIGAISDRDPQPLIIGTKFGNFAIAVAGLIENVNELASELLKEGETFGEMSSGGINSVELIAKLITKGRTIPEGIEGVYDRIKGSASILLLKKDGIFAARDRLGRTPLVIGQKNGEFAIATETCSFLNLGFRIKKSFLLENRGWKRNLPVKKQIRFVPSFGFILAIPLRVMKASVWSWSGSAVEGLWQGTMKSRQTLWQASLTLVWVMPLGMRCNLDFPIEDLW